MTLAEWRPSDVLCSIALMPKKLTGGPLRCRDPKSGTVTGYRRHMDKRKKNKKHQICEACRAAAAMQSHVYRKRRILNGAKQVPRDRSNRNFKLEGGEVLVDATGTRRRLMALQVIGYSLQELGAKLGQNGNNLGYIIRGRRWVMPETTQKIAALYDELSMIPAPPRQDESGNPRSVVLTRSKRKGYPGPLAWDEETIDDPFALPAGLKEEYLWRWYCHAAKLHERMEWVLEYGFPKPKRH